MYQPMGIVKKYENVTKLLYTLRAIRLVETRIYHIIVSS